MRTPSPAFGFVASAALAACASGSPGDTSALDDPKSPNGFIVATAEIADFDCSSRSLEIGRKAADGRYAQVARVTIGTPWSPDKGVQTSLPPGEYHVVGMVCATKGNTLTVIPGRREASAVPFSPNYQDSIAQFTIGAREVVSLGAIRFTLGAEPAGKPPFAVSVTPLPAALVAAARQAQPQLAARLTERAPTAVARSVDGRCLGGNTPMDCGEIGKARQLCKQEAPPDTDVAVAALRARLKAVLCG